MPVKRANLVVLGCRYDRHHNAILHSGERHQAGGGPGGVAGGQRPADEVDLYTYFSSTCYSGFGDGPRGFYGVYDELFSKLAAQEAEAQARRAAGRQAGRAAAGSLPRFGEGQRRAVLACWWRR